MGRNHLLGLFTLFLLSTGCSPRQALNAPWVRDVSLQIDGRKTQNEHYTEVLQVRPNTSVFGVFPYLWIYHQARVNRTGPWDNWLRRFGEKPVLLDSLLIAKDKAQLSLRLKQDGYFYPAVVEEFNQGRHGGRLTYNIEQGPLTRISTYDMMSMGPAIEPFIPELYNTSPLTHTGQALRMELLDAERRRVAAFLQDKGFFTLGPDAIHFELDTLDHPTQAFVKVRIDNWNRDTEYGPVEEPHRIWVLRQVKGDWPSALQIHPRGIQRLPWLTTGQPFKASEVTRSTQKLHGIPAIQSGKWQFDMVGDSLNARLQITPAPRVGLTWKTEGTTLSGIYGMQSSLDLFDHNPWGGLEHLNLTLSAGVGAQLADSSTLFNTYFVDLEGGLQWPGLWGWADAPIQAGSTRLAVSVGRQYRREFDRIALRTSLKYNATTRKGNILELSPLDITYIDLRQVDSLFYSALSIKSGFQDILLVGPRFRWVRPLLRKGRWEGRLEGSLESSGIGLDLWMRTASSQQNRPYRIAGVPYAHYVRAEWDARALYFGQHRNSWAFRCTYGQLYTLANTPGLPPFERAFFAGGSNDLRGWQNFRLGPGAMPMGVFDSTGYLGSGTLKALAQIEYRFALSKSLQGAIFTDAGNTWLQERNIMTSSWSPWQNPSIQEAVTFQPKNILKQSAWDAGIGLRYDVDFFIIRADWGLQIHDPRRSNPWFSPKNVRTQSTLNLGLGLPF